MQVRVLSRALLTNIANHIEISLLNFLKRQRVLVGIQRKRINVADS